LKLLRVGGNKWKEADSGDYIALCTKIDPDYQYKKNHKLAIYFVIIEGDEIGSRAILYYNKLSQVEAEKGKTDFGAKSKFFTDIKKLFPEIGGDGSSPVEIDLDDLFGNETFRIKVERSDKGQATVIDIDHDLGF